ncbi:MAG TPA: HepT-like ribonuclease domain-containing protein [Cryomorphaceae bacterium]|nr:HepT-like ribonuclease domain-containing protein [Cryomorphaceae bacterium]HKL40893.1 HepT-like ribonuclease domain-containing protein [Cryomorphaceae bacterium]
MKYLLDMESAISEIEKIVDLNGFNYSDFSANFMAIRAAERDLMIIGEAMSKLKKIDSNIDISGTRDIVGLRNMLVHY